MSNFDIRKLINTKPGAQELLDGLVHDVAGKEASRVNNSGLKDQIEFLNRNGMTDEGILQYLEEATDG